MMQWMIVIILRGSNLHGCTHGIEEVDNDKGEDGENDEGMDDIDFESYEWEGLTCMDAHIALTEEVNDKGEDGENGNDFE